MTELDDLRANVALLERAAKLAAEETRAANTRALVAEAKLAVALPFVSQHALAMAWGAQAIDDAEEGAAQWAIGEVEAFDARVRGLQLRAGLRLSVLQAERDAARAERDRFDAELADVHLTLADMQRAADDSITDGSTPFVAALPLGAVGPEMDGLDAILRTATPAGLPAPIPMFLSCPACTERHIDEGEFATKRHHTHSCQSCGLTWRPAVEATVGVQFLPGFKNEPARMTGADRGSE